VLCVIQWCDWTTQWLSSPLSKISPSPESCIPASGGDVDRAQEQREGEKLQGVRPEKLWHMLGEGRRGGGGESSQRHKKGEVETD
jgi:hypothetical protein